MDAPGCGGDARNPVFRLNLAFIDYNSTEFSSVFVPLQRVSDDGRDIHLSSKVPGEIAEMGSLFDDRTGAMAIVPHGQGKIK